MSHKRLLKTEASKRAKGTKPSFNVVIVYDDRNAASRAMNVLSGLIRQLGDDFDFRCDLWRFDVLSLPQIQKAAARAGDSADLLMIAASGEIDLPMPVKDWLNWCADGKTPGSTALVALLESPGRLGAAQCRTREFLQSAAARGFMDFFLHETDLPHAGPRWAPATLGEGANPVSRARPSILRRGEPPPGSRAPE